MYHLRLNAKGADGYVPYQACMFEWYKSTHRADPVELAVRKSPVAARFRDAARQL